MSEVKKIATRDSYGNALVEPVSYTHLDVYKRQPFILMCSQHLFLAYHTFLIGGVLFFAREKLCHPG